MIPAELAQTLASLSAGGSTASREEKLAGMILRACADGSTSAVLCIEEDAEAYLQPLRNAGYDVTSFPRPLHHTYTVFWGVR